MRGSAVLSPSPHDLTAALLRRHRAGKKEAAAAPAAPAPIAAGYNRWDAAEFTDGAAQAKFRKLMGVKGVAAAGGDASAR
jgi:hypothetical protein